MLSEYILIEIMKYLSLKERTRFERTCKTWGFAIATLWKCQKSICFFEIDEKESNYISHITLNCKHKNHCRIKNREIIFPYNFHAWKSLHSTKVLNCIILNVLKKCPNIVHLNFNGHFCYNFRFERMLRNLDITCPKIEHIQGASQGFYGENVYISSMREKSKIPTLTCSEHRLIRINNIMYCKPINDMDNINYFQANVLLTYDLWDYKPFMEIGKRIKHFVIDDYTGGKKIKSLCEFMPNLVKFQIETQLCNINILCMLKYVEELGVIDYKLYRKSVRINQYDNYLIATQNSLQYFGNNGLKLKHLNLEVHVKINSALNQLANYCPNITILKLTLHISYKPIINCVQKLKQLRKLSLECGRFNRCFQHCDLNEINVLYNNCLLLKDFTSTYLRFYCNNDEFIKCFELISHKRRNIVNIYNSSNNNIFHVTSNLKLRIFNDLNSYYIKYKIMYF
jgi:F-box domain